ALEGFGDKLGHAPYQEVPQWIQYRIISRGITPVAQQEHECQRIPYTAGAQDTPRYCMHIASSYDDCLLSQNLCQMCTPGLAVVIFSLLPGLGMARRKRHAGQQYRFISAREEGNSSRSLRMRDRVIHCIILEKIPLCRRLLYGNLLCNGGLEDRF